MSAKIKEVDHELIEKAKQKAIQLVDKFRRHVDSHVSGEHTFEFSKMKETVNAKACAQIVCDEKLIGEQPWLYKFALYTEVKNQIEKL